MRQLAAAFSADTGWAPACWRFEFHIAKAGMLGHPLGNKYGCSKLQFGELPRCKAAASYRTPNSSSNLHIASLFAAS